MPPLQDRSTWLHGDSAHCLQPPSSPRPWRLVLLGPPGVGKGTQSELLAAALGACPLSTGALFRSGYDHSLYPGSAMAEALDRVNHGQLVPDDVVLSLIRNRRTCLRCPGGFLLDGFPRTLTQACALDGLLALEHVQLDAVLCYDLPVARLVERMSGRRVCPRCHAVYHTSLRPPRYDGICDQCSWSLAQLPDDYPDAVKTRLAAYAAAAAQVAQHYQRQELVLHVDADGSPDEILRRTFAALSQRGCRLPTASAASPSRLESCCCSLT